MSQTSEFYSSPPSSSRSAIPILIMSIEIGDGRSDSLTLYDSDIPVEAAQAFSRKHNLSSQLHQRLLEHIQSNLDDLTSQQTGDYWAEWNKLMKEVNSKRQLKLNNATPEKAPPVPQQIPKKPQHGSLSARAGENSTSNSCAEFKVPRRKPSRTRPKPEKTEISELKKCTFVPEISDKAKNISNDKRIFDRLYQEAHTRREKSSEKQASFPFHPEVKSDIHVDVPVVDRLYKPRIHQELQLQLYKSKLNQMVDPVTGQDFFKPQINTYYKHTKQASSESHTIRCQRTQNPKDLQAKSRSDKLFYKLKIKSYYEIFKLLGPSHNEEIVSGSLTLDRLNDSVRKTLEPLILEIEDIKQPLNFEDFVEAMENLIKALSPADKKIVLFGAKEKIEAPKPSVKKIDPLEVYKRNTEKQCNTERKLEGKRQENFESCLKGCTFKPKLTPYRREKYYYNI